MDKRLTTNDLMKLSSEYGDAFYLLDTKKFRENYNELTSVFKSYYSKFNIAYSYKTNYIPALCKLVYQLGGYAEIVSDLELAVALKCGVDYSHIIWNGPIKNADVSENFLLHGGTINLDNFQELENIKATAEKYKNTILNIGIRCNYDVNDGIVSRFGIDTESKEFNDICQCICETPNLHLTTIHCHFAKRNPQFWQLRVDGILKVYDLISQKYGLVPDHIDIGGGIYGHMPNSLCQQLGVDMYIYDDYAKIAAKKFAEKYKASDKIPELLLEPGTALSSDCMKAVFRVDNIKIIREKTIATVLGSQKNISMSEINPPIYIVPGGGKRKKYTDLDFAGYTCIESDFLYRHYDGELAIGDFLVISNCGSYSLVMKPPFILPNFPVLDIGEGLSNIRVVKRPETFEDLFQTYNFSN